MPKRILLLVLLAGLALPAAAAELAGVKMPDRVDASGKSLVLNGMGVRKATILRVKVYVAGLYLEQKSTSAAEILSSTQIKRLVLYFVHDASQSQVSDAWKEGFAKNAGNVAPLQNRLNQLVGFMTDFRPGNSLVFTYRPNSGVEVAVNQQIRGTLPGDDFARALFSIWLGPKPPNDDLKAGLLGLH